MKTKVINGHTNGPQRNNSYANSIKNNNDPGNKNKNYNRSSLASSLAREKLQNGYIEFLF